MNRRRLLAKLKNLPDDALTLVEGWLNMRQALSVFERAFPVHRQLQLSPVRRWRIIPIIPIDFSNPRFVGEG